MVGLLLWLTEFMGSEPDPPGLVQSVDIGVMSPTPLMFPGDNGNYLTMITI
jgi:hypothetical protein